MIRYKDGYYKEATALTAVTVITVLKK